MLTKAGGKNAGANCPIQACGNSFAYTGAVIDTETGLYYMNARYYDTETGRFISQDSYRGDGEAFWHLYIYCDSDPVNATDPSGHAVKKIIDVGNDLKNLFKLAIRTGYRIRSLICAPLLACRVIGFYKFYELVKTGAIYDIKNAKWFKDKYKDKKILFNNKNLRYDDPGNILFGFFAGACGIDENFACFGAGLYQIYSGTFNWEWLLTSFGDDPQDTAMIRYGYSIYRKEGRVYW